MNFYTLFNPVRKKRGRLFKVLLVMKLVIILITVACLQVSARVLAQKVTLDVKDAPLEQVFNDIKRQTGYIFFYESNVLNGTSRVSINVKNADLRDVLDLCFKGQPLVYTIAGNTIGIKKREIPPLVQEKPQQSKDVTGRISNKAGEPLAGATVTIKRTKSGTLADANGSFTVRGVSSTDTLIFSFIGYSSLSVRVGNETVFKVTLEETSNKLDQVVVRAYGQTTQRLATGNIARVTAEEIGKQPIMNPLLALQGQVPGLEITTNSGYLSGPVKVELRGRNSITNNTISDPLYIIDGVPLTVVNVGGSFYGSGSSGFIQNGMAGPAGGQSALFSLEPADIESIEVLKDGDATAIYGSRAANGVILITTKKGKAGKTQFSVNATEGLSEVTRHWDMLNTQQYLQMRQEAFKNDGVTPTVGNAPDLLVWDTNRYTDWQKFLWGNTGKSTDVQTSLSGGDALTVFRIAAGYHRVTEITTTSGANENTSVSFNLSHHTRNQKFSVSFTTNYSYSNVNMISIPNGAAILPPDAPSVYDGSGNLNYAEWDAKVGSFPFGNLLQPYDSKTNFLTTNLTLNYNILKGFVIRTSMGYNNAQATQTSFIPIASLDPASNPTGSSSFGNNSNHNLIVEPQLEYNGIIGRGKLNILLGGSYQKNTTDGLQVNGIGYTNDALLRTITNAPHVISNDNYGEYKYVAAFGRLGYNWDNKYILNLNARRDGASSFGPGNQFGNFGSLGAAWILSEEGFIKRFLPSFISFFKLRGSYGTTGGDIGNSYAYLSRWSGNNLYTYNGVSPLVPLQHANTDYHWQVNRKLEGALDLGFLKDRINLNIAYYRDRCDNQLVNFPTAEFTGFTSVIANSPANVENTGWEFLVSANIIDAKNFHWSMNFNTGFNQNKLLSYPNLALSPYANQYRIGQPLNISWALHMTGVDPQTGQYTYKDRNHDGLITLDYSIPPGTGDDDQYPIVLTPKFTGGLTNSFSYKRWNMSFLLYFKKQIGLNAFLASQLPGSMHNQSVYVFQNSWQKPGDITGVARLTTISATSDSYLGSSDGIYTDASFIRVSNLSVSYNLPDVIGKKLGLTGLNIFLHTNNLFTITKYKGIDPDVQNFGGLPPAKTIVIGINCNF
ncbi:SusC/RagA family TonB-linked outer membrane protein [Mucilaginibacter ginsenosidivorans]|nr:SusC/RagA family TonB-linked outer membrane protein [Mucilaginibacter ginsenosidivorans]